MNNVTETLPKGESIPRIPGNRFLQENWDPSSPIYGQSKSADIQKEMIIGWCPASKVFFEPKEDDRCLAIDIFRPEILKYFLIPFDEFQFLNYLGKSKTNINDLFKTEKSND